MPWSVANVREMDQLAAHKLFDSLHQLPRKALEATLLFGNSVEELGAAPSLLSVAVRANSIPALQTSLLLLSALDSRTGKRVLASGSALRGATVLHDACLTEPASEEVLGALLGAGAGKLINASADGGLSALMACASHSAAGTRMLLAAHAAIDPADAAGRSALQHACDSGALPPALALVASDAPVSGTALHGCVGAVADRLRASVALVLLVAVAATLAWGPATELCRRVRASLSQLCASLSQLSQLRPRSKRAARKAAKRLGAGGAVARPPPGAAAPPLFLWLRVRPLHTLLLVAALLVAPQLPWTGRAGGVGSGSRPDDTTSNPWRGLLRAEQLFQPDLSSILFPLPFVAVLALGAATNPSLNDGETRQQRASQLAFTRGVALVFLISSHRWRRTAGAVLPFAPGAPGLVALLSGGATLRLSSWLRLCCALHSALFELASLVAGLLGLQLTESTRRRFPAWGILRALCLCIFALDAALLAAIYAYHHVVAAGDASAAARPPGQAEDLADTVAIFNRLLVTAPTQLLLGCGLTFKNRHLLARRLLGLFASDAPEALTHSPSTDKLISAPDDGQCVVCMDDEATHILAPCGHMCVCGTCVGYICAAASPECPMCRAAVVSFVSEVWR